MSKEIDIEQVKHNTKVILNMNKKELDWVCYFLNKIENTQNTSLDSTDVAYLWSNLNRRSKSLNEFISDYEKFLGFAESHNTEEIYDEYYNYIRYVIGDYKSIDIDTVVSFDDIEEEQ